MIGKLGAMPWVSAMSAAQRAWLSTGSTDRPSTLTPRLSNSGFRRATAPNSVVQTGVKSFGCENSTTHLPSAHSWKCRGPSVESWVKSGAMSLSFKVMERLLFWEASKNIVLARRPRNRKSGAGLLRRPAGLDRCDLHQHVAADHEEHVVAVQRRVDVRRDELD